MAELKAGAGEPKVPKIAGSLDLLPREEQAIDIQPIRVAGRLTVETRKAVVNHGNGYSTCDACRKPFRLDRICNPPIATFLNLNQARIVPGARRSFRAVASSLAQAVATRLKRSAEEPQRPVRPRTIP
ncbi:MAG: hypothetical protein ABFC89_08765 [Methanospirillum sp.]